MIRSRACVLLALLAALLAVTTLASPAQAATYARPVTLTATSACLQYQWTVTVTVTSTRARTVDLWDSSDYGVHPITGLTGVVQLGVALQAGVAYRVLYHPGASAQYAEIGAFPPGSGGWDGSADPLAWKTVYDPIRTDPHSTC